MKRVTILAVTAVIAISLGCKRPQPAPAPAPPPPGTAPTAPAAPSTPTTSTAPTASVGGEPIPDLPDYPGATRVGYSVAPELGFKNSVESELFTTEPYEQVRKFYEKAIADGGWRIVRTKAEFNEIEWELAKGNGTSLAEIEVDQERSGGVKVKLERRDR
jgi:hypothetical protein